MCYVSPGQEISFTIGDLFGTEDYVDANSSSATTKIFRLTARLSQADLLAMTGIRIPTRLRTDSVWCVEWQIPWVWVLDLSNDLCCIRRYSLFHCVWDWLTRFLSNTLTLASNGVLFWDTVHSLRLRPFWAVEPHCYCISIYHSVGPWRSSHFASQSLCIVGSVSLSRYAMRSHNTVYEQQVNCK